ncbi:MAG: branched-chain amino acid ABC transporter permease [Oscillospiraceae bacterium]|nr:branched-chain amino acid ABC transporter permease [Oscillospiraceae bacterium]
MKNTINSFWSNKARRTSFVTYAVVILAFIAVQVFDSMGMLSYAMRGQLIPICVYIVLAISLNLVVGISGELSLGHAGFMGVGAFVGAVASTALQSVIPDTSLRLVVAMVVGGIMAGIMGVVIGIPVLRLRGDYLAIVTLAFGEIIRNIANNLYVGKDEAGLHFALLNEDGLKMSETGKLIMAGPRGTVSVSAISTFMAGFVLIMITLFVVLNLVNSKEGRAIKAIRDNRIAAESVGINVMSFKLKAFVVSAVLAGAAGALYGLSMSNVSSVKFSFNTSIDILVFVVLGGMGNILGSVIAATVLTLLPELMRPLADYRMIMYAIVLIVVMLCTWSPKIKGFIQVVTDGVKGWFKKLFRGLFVKKEVGTNG